MLHAELKVLGGKQDGKTIPLRKGKFLIGREEDCHLRPNSELISRHHCAFTVDDFAVCLRDLGSTNGTFVNEERVHGQRMLNAGDRVRVGRFEFELQLDAAPVGPAARPAPGMATAELSGTETVTDMTLAGILGGRPSDTALTEHEFKLPPSSVPQPAALQPAMAQPPMQQPAMQAPVAAMGATIVAAPPVPVTQFSIPVFAAPPPPTAHAASAHGGHAGAHGHGGGATPARASTIVPMPMQLPNPEDTGAKEAPPKPKSTGEKPPEKISDRAADIIKQFRSLRPGGNSGT